MSASRRRPTGSVRRSRRDAPRIALKFEQVASYGQHSSYTPLMRLTKSEVLAIEAAAKAVLPRGARVLLFGSRTDDARRGGDIDLLVEPPTPVDASLAADLSTRLAARLYRLIGERRIDIVVAAASEADDRLIVREARRHAIELART